MILTEQVTILSEIEAGLDTVSPEVLKAVGGKMQKPQKGEKPLGVIHNEVIKKLYVFARHCGCKVIELKHQAELMEEGVEEQELLHEANKYDLMEDLARDILFTQLRIDLRTFGQTIAMRRDWLACVGVKEDESPSSFLRQLLQGNQE